MCHLSETVRSCQEVEVKDFLPMFRHDYLLQSQYVLKQRFVGWLGPFCLFASLGLVYLYDFLLL